MKELLGAIGKVLLITLVAVWIGIILTEFVRYKNNEPMLFEIKNEILTYDDGRVEVSYGLGYKEIIYNRTSIYGKEFGHLFIKVKERIE